MISGVVNFTTRRVKSNARNEITTQKVRDIGFDVGWSSDFESQKPNTVHDYEYHYERNKTLAKVILNSQLHITAESLKLKLLD